MEKSNEIYHNSSYRCKGFLCRDEAYVQAEEEGRKILKTAFYDTRYKQKLPSYWTQLKTEFTVNSLNKGEFLQGVKFAFRPAVQSVLQCLFFPKMVTERMSVSVRVDYIRYLHVAVLWNPKSYKKKHTRLLTASWCNVAHVVQLGLMCWHAL